MIQLLDHIPGAIKVDYQDPAAKRIVLENYFKSVEHSVIGRKEDVVIDELIRDLKVKSSIYHLIYWKMRFLPQRKDFVFLMDIMII